MEHSPEVTLSQALTSGAVGWVPSAAATETLEVLRAGADHPIVQSFSAGAILVFDCDLRYLVAGGLALADVGLSTAMMEGKTIFEVFEPGFIADIEPQYRLALSGVESVIDLNYQGNVYSQRLAPVRDADGQIVAGMGYTQDVTHARRSELRLRESEEHNRLAFEYAPIGNAITALDGRYIRVNQAMCDLTGYTADQLCRRAESDITHPDDLAADAAASAQLQRGDMAASTVEKRFLTATGTTVWASQSASLMRAEDGSPLQFIVQIQDITERKNYEQVLAEEHRRLRDAKAELQESLIFQEAVVASSPDIVTVFDIESMQTVWASHSLVDVLGHTMESMRGKQGQGMATFIHPDDLATFDYSVQQTKQLADTQVALVEVRAQHGDGTWHTLERRSTPFRRDDGGSVVQLLTVNRDITTQRALSVELEQRRAFQEAVISTTPDVILLVDNVIGRLTWASRPVDDLLGWSWEDLQALGDTAVESLLHPDYAVTFRELERAARQAAPGEVVQATYKARHRNGTWRWISRRMTPFGGPSSGDATQSLAMVRDVTNIVDAQQQLEHAALHDPLTALPNRVLVVDRLQTALAATSRGGRVAVLYIDLDGFKRINDAFGHAAGDAVLTATAERMRKIVRPADTVGRMGGDEFVVVLQPTDSDIVDGVARSISERLREKIAEPVTHRGIAHTVTCSVGITTATNADIADDVLRNADSAMYRAKTGGKNRLAVFDPDQYVDAVHRSSVEQSLRAAIRDDGIEVRYQPIVRTMDGAVAGAEALLRIRDHNGDYLDTQHAVHIAEQTGLIAAIGQRVLHQACTQATLWDETTTMSVNLTAAELATPDLYTRIRTVLADTGLPAGRLVIELTETVLLEAAHSTIRDLERLRDAGIGIAIDDFGTGYASVRYLCTLPATCVKIDRSLTAGLGTDPVVTTLVEALIQLTHDLKLDCIFEGVETRAQLDTLGHHPRLYVQGYHLAHPAAPTPTINELLT